MAANQSFLINWAQYLAVRGVCGFIQCFDVEQNLQTAGAVGRLFCQFNRKRRQRAEMNIAQSFPEWSKPHVAATAQRSMEYMFQMFMVESMMTPRLITPSTWRQRVQFNNIDPLIEMLLEVRPVILVTAHHGNWELLAGLLAAIGFPIVALARPLDNPLLNRWIMGIREARGTRIITKWGGTPILQDTLNAGGRVGFIADQNAGDQGLFVPFFGRLASSYKSIGLLAMRHNVPIVAGGAIRMGEHFQYELVVTDYIHPEEWADQPDPLFYITARYNRALEMTVRRAPEQYLWLHRRWKSRPRHEREGKPIPGRLMEKLQQLPWMTQAELDRIVQSSSCGGAQADLPQLPPRDEAEPATLMP